MSRIAWLLFPLLGVVSSAHASEDSWTTWRGPRMSGLAPDANPAIEWSESKNIAWKVRLAGHGSSTPIIWKDRLYVLTAVPTSGEPPPLPSETEPRSRRGGPASSMEQAFRVLAIERSTGRPAWERTTRVDVPHEGKQQNNSYASASAITDGELLFAHFGSWGLYCYDLDGALKWERDFGNMSTRSGFGEGATPALFRETLVVNWDHEGESFIAALDKRTGRELWRRSRDEVTTWATPLVVEVHGRPQVITTGYRKVRSYDLETGESVWEAPGLTLNPIPSPLEHDGVLYVTSGFRGNAAFAVRLAEAKGDIAGSSAVLWQVDRDTPYVPSPLLYEGILYLVKSNSGILSALDAGTGRVLHGPTRLETIAEIYASPVGASGRVYILGRDGNALVLENGRELKILARNSLDDGFDASPALAGDEMYLRGYRYLYKIASN